MKSETIIVLLKMAQITICCFGVYMILGESTQVMKIVWGGIIAFNLLSIFKTI